MLTPSKVASHLLEDMRPQHYNGMNRAQTVRTINDILQGRTERTGGLPDPAHGKGAVAESGEIKIRVVGYAVERYPVKVAAS